MSLEDLLTLWLESGDHKEAIFYTLAHFPCFPSPHTFFSHTLWETAASLQFSWRKARPKHGKAKLGLSIWGRTVAPRSSKMRQHGSVETHLIEYLLKIFMGEDKKGKVTLWRTEELGDFNRGLFLTPSPTCHWLKPPEKKNNVKKSSH